MSTLQELEDLVPDYQYVDGDRVVLTVGIRATFYFWGGHSAPKRKALVECVEAYEQAYGTCSVHGRYRSAANGKAEEEQNESPEVVMLPGDIAPYWLKLGPHGALLGRELVTWELIGQL